MAGIHRSSTLAGYSYEAVNLLGMAGIHRSSTLKGYNPITATGLGMAGIHRSSTLIITNDKHRYS